MEKAKYTASQVAEWFLNHVRSLSNEEDEEYLTNLKLQKLLYYAQGTSLALCDKPLFDDPIIHWQHGPVVTSVYYLYSDYRGNPILYDGNFMNVFDSEATALLQDVYDTFGCYSAWGLRNMTHREDPWKDTQPWDVITNESIKIYFKNHYVE